MNIVKCGVVAAAAFGLFTCTPALAVNLVINGGFETGDFAGWAPPLDASASGVTGLFDGAVAPTEGAFQAFFGSDRSGGDGIFQNLVTTPGTRYTLSFDLAYLGGTINGFGVGWASDFIITEFDVPAFEYTRFSIDLIAMGENTPLSFVFESEPSFFLLDNVSVTAAAIPEPASWALLIAGFGLVGAVQRRCMAARAA